MTRGFVSLLCFVKRARFVSASKIWRFNIGKYESVCRNIVSRRNPPLMRLPNRFFANLRLFVNHRGQRPGEGVVHVAPILRIQSEISLSLHFWLPYLLSRGLAKRYPIVVSNQNRHRQIFPSSAIQPGGEIRLGSGFNSRPRFEPIPHPVNGAQKFGPPGIIFNFCTKFGDAAVNGSGAPGWGPFPCGI